MSSDPLHLITVQETASTEIVATGAKLVVRIAGQSVLKNTAIVAYKA
ncbi:MAG: hypothetical protein JXM70_19335 [Pirellulales bacterium]|nr:hypothetical protein [Pirellulales bacterium]